jgi:hypothetical protein
MIFLLDKKVYLTVSVEPGFGQVEKPRRPVAQLFPRDLDILIGGRFATLVYPHLPRRMISTAGRECLH